MTAMDIIEGFIAVLIPYLICVCPNFMIFAEQPFGTCGG